MHKYIYIYIYISTNECLGMFLVLHNIAIRMLSHVRNIISKSCWNVEKKSFLIQMMLHSNKDSPIPNYPS